MHRSASHKKQVQRKLNGIFYWKCQFHIRLFYCSEVASMAIARNPAPLFFFLGLTWGVASNGRGIWTIDFFRSRCQFRCQFQYCPVSTPYIKFLFLNRFWVIPSLNLDSDSFPRLKSDWRLRPKISDFRFQDEKTENLWFATFNHDSTTS